MVHPIPTWDAVAALHCPDGMFQTVSCRTWKIACSHERSRQRLRDCLPGGSSCNHRPAGGAGLDPVAHRNSSFRVRSNSLLDRSKDPGAGWRDLGSARFSLRLPSGAALTVYVLWPRRNWRFHFGVDRLHAEYVENAEPLSAGLMTRDLAIHLDAYFGSNARTIDRISLGFAGTLLFLIVEAAAFSYDVVGGQ